MTNAADRAATLHKARAVAHRLSAAIWAVDSAESMLRKAQPSTGYRSTAKLGDQPWDTSAYERQVAAAHQHLADEMLLLALDPDHLADILPPSLPGWKPEHSRRASA